jgi:formate dehydrogenase iron-sulfur subunit
MIYHDTQRVSWRFPLTSARFFGSVLSFGTLACLIADQGRGWALWFGAAVFAKMIPELRILRIADDRDAGWSPELHMAATQKGPLCRIMNGRFAFAALSIAVAFVHPWLALPFLIASEILERQLFFQSVYAPKMPGNFGPARHPH